MMHPHNPFAPTMHFNYRYFETEVSPAGVWEVTVPLLMTALCECFWAAPFCTVNNNMSCSSNHKPDKQQMACVRAGMEWHSRAVVVWRRHRHHSLICERGGHAALPWHIQGGRHSLF